MSRAKSVPLSEQVAFIQETESLLFYRWRVHWQKSHSGRPPDPLRKLTNAQLHAVMVVHFEGRITISRLAELLGVSRPSASIMVERLAAKRMVVREADSNDRRRVLIRVSRDMDGYLDQMWQAKRRYHEELAGKIGPEVFRQWHAAMKRVREVFEAEDGRRNGSG
jgi:DNA-binding MarR family transcriptional regulator